jgi:hypothetical protein
MEGESAISSAKEKGFAATQNNERNVFRGPGRGSGFTAREDFRGFKHPGRGVDLSKKRSSVGNTHVVTEDVARGHVVVRDLVTKIRCHACGAMGHISRNCRKRDKSAWRETNNAGNGDWGQGNSSTGTPPPPHRHPKRY